MKFFLYKLIFLFLLTSPISSPAQKSKANQNIKNEIDKYIKAEMKKEQVPGLTYAIIKDGEIITSGAYGVANVELNAPISMHSLFSIGSIGKIFTATAIMLLQKDGRLSLTDPIAKYLDSLPGSWNNITIKHLLSQTSGIKDHLHDFPGYSYIERDRKQEITEAQFIRMATTVPLNFEPGEKWAYSNAGFVLLGFIIHKVSGQPLPQFMKERVFEPLDMKETRYISLAEIIPNRATGYLLNDTNKVINGDYISNFYSTTADMGIITTAGDMAKWSIALDNEKIIDKQTLQQMWTPFKLNNGMESTNLNGCNYGLAWMLSNYRGYNEIGHNGSFRNGYTANYIRFDEKHLAVIVLCNLNPSSIKWICYNIAAFFVPELKGIDQLKPEQNSDTSFNKNVHALLKGLAEDNLDTSLVTASFKQRINPITKMNYKPVPGIKSSITFIHSDIIADKNLVRYGWPIKKINYYKTNIGNKYNIGNKTDYYIGVFITPDNKIADMREY